MGVVRTPAQHKRGSAVEAVFELGEVARNMLAVDGPVGAGDRGLDVAKRGVNPLEGRFARRRWTASGLDSLVDASGVGYAGETPQPVADHRAAWTNAALGKRGQCLTGETADPSQLDADRLSIRCGLDRGDEGCLSRCPSSALAAGAFAAKISVVHLDPSGQLLGRISFHHHLLELVLDLPSRRLRHAEAPAKLDAGDALLGLGDVIHGAEPGAQRQLGRGEDRSGDRRGLPATCGALKEAAALHLTVLASAASGTDEPIRPARGDNRRSALLLSTIEVLERRLAEPLLELHRIAGHHIPHPKAPRFMFRTIPEAAEEGA